MYVLRQMFGFCIFLGYLGLKAKNKQTIRKGGTHQTRLHFFQGLICQKQRGQFEFCAVKCKNHGFASQLLGFSVDSIFGVRCYLISVLRSQPFEYFALNFVQTCLGAPGSGSFR